MNAGAKYGPDGLGASNVTTGAAFADTDTLTAVDELAAPRLSIALAVTEYVPVATFTQVAEYGALVDEPISVAPA